MNTKRAGAIQGDPLCGLCTRECIEVDKVFDACISRIGDLQFTVTLPNTDGVFPYTFISVNSNGTTQLSNLTITPNSENRNTVSYDATIPVTIQFVDSTGRTFSAPSSVTIHRDVPLRIPADSLTSYQIRVSSVLAGRIGSFSSPNQVTFRCCIVLLTKVVGKVDILVPSYGYAEYPECGGADVCDALSSLVIFPNT
jgi:hypothetical protein